MLMDQSGEHSIPEGEAHLQPLPHLCVAFLHLSLHLQVLEHHVTLRKSKKKKRGIITYPRLRWLKPVQYVSVNIAIQYIKRIQLLTKGRLIFIYVCVRQMVHASIQTLHKSISNKQTIYLHTQTQENVETIKASQTRTAHIDQTPMVGYSKSFTDYDYDNWCLTPFQSIFLLFLFRKPKYQQRTTNHP